MAIISRIRKRSGLLVALIAVALFSFVLSDMFFSGQSMFSGEQNAGEIAGNSISVIAFDNEVQFIAEVQKERRQAATLDEETMNAIGDKVWEKFVNDLAMMPQFHSAGISVSEAEAKYLLLGSDPDPMVMQYFTDPNTNQLIEYFRDPMTGKLKPSSIKTYVDSLPPAEKPRWREFEGALRDTRAKNKYLNIIKKGLFATTDHSKTEYASLNRTVSFKYVMQPYTSLPDSTVKVEEQDLLNYYNSNSYKYKQEASRKLQYVIFDIKPTQEDFTFVKNQVDKLAGEWQAITLMKEDSLFVVREAESRFFDTTHYGKGLLAPQIDSIAHQSEKGTILPVFLEDKKYKLCKVLDHLMSPDSVKARHILIKVPAGDSIAKAMAKLKIDSIKTVIQKKKNFEEMAKKFSEDAGSKDTGGVLGWFTIGKMVPEFQNACFYGKKGEMPVALSSFGYHLIEILDQSPQTMKTSVATIDITVEPGTKTRQDVYNLANDFITKYHTAETFNKGAAEMHLIPSLADPLKETDKTIAGIENPKEMIKWAFNVEEGEVSKDAFAFPDKYVVAFVAEVREEGIATLEQKKEEVEAGAKKAKKAEKFIADMNKIGAKSIEDYASKMNLQLNPGEGATFSSYTIPNIGRELSVFGPLFTLKEGQMSKPIAGETGVYVIKVDKIIEAPPTTDYSSSRTQVRNNYIYRVDAESIEAIKKHAKIIDNRAKFF